MEALFVRQAGKVLYKCMPCPAWYTTYSSRLYCWLRMRVNRLFPSTKVSAYSIAVGTKLYNYAVCYNRKVALNSILNHKKNITSSSLLCYNSIAQNYYRIRQGRRLIKRCRYTFSHQISMLPLPKNMKNDFSAALPPMQYNA